MIVIDADLQDPPEVIPTWSPPGARASTSPMRSAASRAGETWAEEGHRAGLLPADGQHRRAGAAARRYRRLPADEPARAWTRCWQLRERHRFMKGLFAWVGFPARAVPYDRAPRAAGTTKWNYCRLLEPRARGHHQLHHGAAAGRHLARPRHRGCSRWSMAAAGGGEGAALRRPGAGLSQPDGRGAVPRRRAAR